MVEYWEMGDKQSQQRRRRADGAVRSVADRSAVEENRALAPQTAQTTQGWSSVDRESPCAGRHSVDFAEWGSLARSSGGIPSPSTCWRRLRDWEEQDVWLKIWRTFLGELNERQHWSGASRSGRQFCSCEKRGCGVGKTKRGKGTKWMVVVDGRGLPLGNHLHSASPAEVKLAETTLAAIRVGRRIRRGGLDKNRFGSSPTKRTIAILCESDCGARNRVDRPHKRIAFDPRRRMAEPCAATEAMDRGTTNAWLGNFRRLVVRHDRSLTIYGRSFISPAS